MTVARIAMFTVAGSYLLLDAGFSFIFLAKLVVHASAKPSQAVTQSSSPARHAKAYKISIFESKRMHSIHFHCQLFLNTAPESPCIVQERGSESEGMRSQPRQDSR